jgi:rubrerythrin
MPIDKANLATVERMWRREVEAATTYRHLADRERDPKRKSILVRLADQEDNHAARWAERIAATTGRHPDRKAVERGLSWFQRISDPNVVLHRLEQEENQAEAEYDLLMTRLSDPADRQIAADAKNEERDHAVILRTLAGGAIPTPRATLDTILRRERWHVRGAGWIGDAIYGVNDGLGAVFGIVSGMAGYTGGSEVVLAAGLAGTLASALSMGAGAYLAAKSEREVYESEVARERTENNSCARWCMKSSACPRRVFRIRSGRRSQQASRPPSAGSSRSFPSFSRLGCQRSSRRSRSAPSPTSWWAPPRLLSRRDPGGPAVPR